MSTPAAAQTSSRARLAASGSNITKTPRWRVGGVTAPQAAELGHDFVRNAGYGLTRLLTQRIESAIGQHIAHRPGAAQASGGFNQANACAGLGRANGSPDACSAATDNENVILVFYNHCFSLDGFSVDVAPRMNPAPRTVRIIGASFGPLSLRRSRPMCTSTRFVSGRNL